MDLSDHLRRIIHPSVQIPDLDKVGKFTKISSNVIIGQDTNVGNSVNIDENVRIGEKCEIADYCKIQDGVEIRNYSKVGDNVQFDQPVDECTQLFECDNFKTDVEIGMNSIIHEYVNISNNVTAGSKCIFDIHSKIGANTRIGERVYIGKHVTVLPGCSIGSHAVLCDNAIIPENGIVRPYDLIIRTPSSDDLYSDCLDYRDIRKDL